jgi:hypothetical protein
LTKFLPDMAGALFLPAAEGGCPFQGFLSG